MKALNENALAFIILLPLYRASPKYTHTSFKIPTAVAKFAAPRTFRAASDCKLTCKRNEREVENNGSCDPVTMTGLSKPGRRYDNAEAVHASVSVPCRMINASYFA